jgi:hypothetical protein
MKVFLALILSIVMLVVPAAQVQASTILESTDSIEVVTSAAVNIDYTASYADHTASAFTPSKSAGQITTATTTTVIAAPASSTQRQIKQLTLRNVGAAANTLTIQRDVSGVNRVMFQAVLGAGETLILDANDTFKVFTSGGLEKVRSVDTGYNGRAYAFQKVGTAKDAAGYWIAHAKDAGFPGAYVLQSPGLNGFNTDCSLASQTTNPNGAAQMGAHQLVDAVTGSYYITGAVIQSSIAEYKEFIDVLWYNTGISVTTTTAQTITMPGALPARSADGSTNGDGVFAALLTTTANTNAAVITNTTITYTDSDGNAGNTGTFSASVGWQAPATPVIGTWMPFQLAAGDRGIRSIQSLTLGTSYGGGALSLILYRPLIGIGVPTANFAVANPLFPAPGVRVYNDTCVWMIEVGSASAATVAGNYTIMER